MRVLIYRIFSLDDPPRTDIFLGMKPRTMQISTSVDCYLLIYLKRWDSFTIRPTDSRAVTHLKTPNNPKKRSCLQNILISSYILHILHTWSLIIFLYTRKCMICIYYRVMCANMSCLNGMAIWHLAIILWQTPRVRKRPSMVSQSSSVSQQGAHRTGTSWIMLDQGAAAKFFRYLGSGQNFIQLSVVCIYSSVNHASFRFLRGFPVLFERFFARKSWQVRMIGKWMHWLGEDPAWGQWRYNSMNMIVSIIE